MFTAHKPSDERFSSYANASFLNDHVAPTVWTTVRAHNHFEAQKLEEFASEQLELIAGSPDSRGRDFLEV
jgi:hypothetical protein